MGFFSSCDGYLGEPLELHKGSQASFQVVRGIAGLLLSHCRGIGPRLMLKGECCGFTQVAKWNLGILLNWDRDLREPLMLPQGSQASFRVVRCTSEFLSSHCREIGPHLHLGQKTVGCSPVGTAILGFMLSFNRGVRPWKGLGVTSTGPQTYWDLPPYVNVGLIWTK